MAALILVLAAHAPTAGAAAPADDISTTATTTATLHLRALDEAALRRDLSLRSPGLELREVTAEGDAPPDAVIVVRPAGDGFALTIVLQDGRAFDRQVAADGPQAPRIVASTLANLLAAIAEARVAADRDAVDASREIAALDAGESTLEPEPEPEPARRPEPGPEAEPETEPEPEPEPLPRDDAKPWRLGADLAPQALLQLPSDRGLEAFGGAGLGLSLTAQSPRGARLGVDLRGLWWRENALALHRYRVALRGGYAFERGRFSLAVDAFIAVEPWQLRADGQPLAVAADDLDDATTTALAGGLRLLPAYLVPLGDRPARLRVAAWTELAYAGVPVEGGLRAIYLRAEGADDPSLRVGGVELSLGALIGVDFDLPRRR